MEESRSPHWLSIISMVVTLLFSGVFATWLHFLSIRIEKYQTVASYLNTLTDAGSPIYLKGLVLSSLLRYGLIEADLVFSTAYSAESTHGRGILKDLFYEYAAHEEMIPAPIGYVDLDRTCVTETKVIIPGWALDSKGIESIEVWFDGEPAPDVVQDYGQERSDIKAVFRKYPKALNSGFHIRLVRTNRSLGVHRLRVRLQNTQRRLMEILDANVEISQRGARIVISDS